MDKKILLLATALTVVSPVFAGLPEALMSLNYKQYTTALAEFQNLAEQGNVASLFYLGRMYQNGWGVLKNVPLAVNYFKAADESFYLPAAAQLGKIWLYGSDGVAANPTAAIHLLKKAALAGDAEAAFELGNASLSGLGGDPDFNHAFGFYLIAALKGDKKAQFQLSQMYLVGRGVPQNHQKALTWMTRSANQGYVRAQLELAHQLENNPKLKNLSGAYAWNSILAAYNSDVIGAKAAQKRDELALNIKQKNLQEYQTTIRSWSPKTPEESVPEEERRNTPTPIIPDFNDPKTLQQILLQEGSLPQDTQEFGLATETVDIAEATGDRLALTNAIQKALKRGKIKAAAYYGDLLYKRFHDPEEAVKWYQTGADSNDAYAQYQLARSYCEGWAGAPDAARCYGWLLTTSETPDPVLNGLIQQALLTVRANASPDEIERGEAQAEAFKKKEAKKEKQKKLFDLF
ncbi:MAG: sel1 repeat family protein [Alphaproteobacteria bacterium]|nr:sel1 repeat family protein [Alphaproteobacteria bacterium]